ncbi:DUF262 domain-containing protein [Deinococcus sp. ME38]|uniref:DUF262 domain-containing protein n=1 Tax=Deinococcus sp. ME38 TaxID=3400344 RepID=UPI003B58D977
MTAKMDRLFDSSAQIQIESQSYIEEVDDDEISTTQNPRDPDLIALKYAESQLRILRTNNDWPLHYVKQVLESGEMINISPEYQRRNRWDRRTKSLLIESFLLNIPIPPVYLYEYEYGSYEVMDGLQRMTAISEFFQDKFALIGLEFWKELNGLKFSRLPKVIQSGLMRRNLSAIVLLAETTQISSTHQTIDVRQALFKRLNTGGEPLNHQEIRNALYNSDFNRMLHQLSREDIFCRIWKIPLGDSENPIVQAALEKNTLYRTMLDCEIVLRVFAISESISLNEGGSVKSMLDKCMIRHKDDSLTSVKELHDLYMHTLTRWYNTLGENAFVLNNNGRVSRPLYDALMIALLKNPVIQIESEPDRIREDINTALNNDIDYEILIARGNTFDSVKARIDLGEKIISGTYEPSEIPQE